MVGLLTVMAGLIEQVVTDVKTDGAVDYATGNITGASRIEAALSGISQQAGILGANGLEAGTSITNRVQNVEGEVDLVGDALEGEIERVDIAEADIHANATALNDPITGLAALAADIQLRATTSSLNGINGSMIRLYSFMGVTDDEPPTATPGGRMSGVYLPGRV